MATFVKEIAGAGSWPLKDGRRIRLTAKDIRHLNRRAAEMVNAGLHIPIAWGHQPVKPMTREDLLAQKVKNVIGHLEGVGLTAEGRLKGIGDVQNPEDAAKLPSIKHVSPEIERDFKDRYGKVWPGLSITHLAVTAKPVNGELKPFESVQMSEDGHDVYRLAMDDMEPDAGGDEGGGGDETPAKSGRAADLEGLIEDLKAHGFNIPDGVDDLKKLRIAIQSNDNDAVTREGEGAGSITESTPALMSLDDSSDPRDKRELTRSRQDLDRRAAALIPAGKATGDVVKKLRTDLKAERLYLDRQGKLSGGKALVRLEVLEEMPGNGFLRPAQMSHDGISEQAMPDGRARDEEEQRELARKHRQQMRGGAK